MGSVAHVEVKRKEPVKDVHKITHLRVHFMNISDNIVKVDSGG